MRRLSHACAQTRTIGAGVLDRQIRVVVEYCGEFREAAFIIRILVGISKSFCCSSYYSTKKAHLLKSDEDLFEQKEMITNFGRRKEKRHSHTFTHIHTHSHEYTTMVARSSDIKMSSQAPPLPLMIQSSISIKKLGQKVRLPADFTPGKYAVLCGRGSKCTKSQGNKRLRELVDKNLKGYSGARNKVDKTAIVSNIIQAVKQLSPEGAFVKYEDGDWWEVEDTFAREKIGCLFRDSLHHQYRSSTKAKLARKKAVSPCSSVGKQRTQAAPQCNSMNTKMPILGGAFKKTGDMKFLFGSPIQPRSDFLQGCLSDFSKVMRNQQAISTGINNRQRETSSVLRRACGIIGGQSEIASTANNDNRNNIYNTDNGDLPDDLSDISDIFEDELLDNEDDFFTGFEQRPLASFS